MEELSKEERKKLHQSQMQQKMKKEQHKNLFKKLSWWIGGALALGLVVWVLIASAGSSSSSQNLNITIPPVTANDLINGPSTAKVTIVEYADFQCPGCGSLHPLLKQLLADENGKVRLVYRYFPLEQLHKNAKISAQAAYAANLQGKFWSLHDMLFEHQSDWAEVASPENIFVAYAQNLGLDTKKFLADMEDPKTAAFIVAEENKALNLGLPGTPSLFVNGKYISGNPSSYAALKSLVDQAK